MEDEAGLGQTAMCHAPSCADQGGKMQDSMGLQSCSASFTKAMLEEEWYMAGAGDNSIMDDMKQLAYSASSPLQLPLPLTMPLSDGGHGGPSIFGQLDGPGTHFQPFLPPGRGMAAGFGRDDRSGSGMSLSSLLDGALTFDASPGFIGGFSGGGGGGGYNAGGGSQLDVLADLQDGVQVGQSHVGVLSGFGMAGGNLMCGTAGNGLSPGRVHNVGMSNLSPRSPLGGLNGDGYGGSMNGGIGNMLTNGMGGGGFGGFGTPLSGNGGGYGDPFANSLMRSFGGKDGVVTSAMLLGGGGGGSSDKLQQQHQLRPLGGGPPQTLFQKRAARLAAGSSSPSVKSGPRLLTANASPCDSSVVDMADQASPNVSHNKRKAQAPAPRVHDSLLDEFGMGGDPSDDFKDDDDLDESGDGSVMLYETASDEMLGLDGGCQGLMSSGGGGEKGKGKKGPPAKNLMAERRRRKKLNERLYTLRAVVPKITKMDRASILGDAIEHLRSLLQQIRDLHQELENPPERQLPPSPSGLLPSSSNLGCRVKEEFPTPLPSPDSQAARVQVVIREGRTLNIHMFCARRPGLLLSTMRALDGLGLDVQQAVISCFNGFALDVFRAEQLKEVEVGEDEIRRVLLRTAGCISSL